MDTDRLLCTWVLLGLVLVAMTAGEPDPLRRRFGDETRRRRIKVVTIQSDPYIRLNWSRGLIGNERYEGYYIDLISRVADLAGFDYSLHLVADGKLGNEGDEGGWTGMVGELISETADLTLGPLSISRERQAVVDFTTPIAEVRLAVIMAKPKDQSSTTVNPTNLPALLARTDLRFAALRDSDAIRALRMSLDSNARSLYRRLQEQSMTSLMGNMYEALEFVRREGYALVLDLPTAEYYIGREPCDLVLVASFLEGRHYALATRKGVPLLGEINRALETLKGQGSQWRHLRRKWWQPQCPGVSVEGAAGGEETNVGKPSNTESSVTNNSPSSAAPILHVKVTTELNPPFVVQPPGGELTGYTIELLENIARLVPFRYDVTFPRDRAGFGKRKRNQWNGMAGELVREEVDLAAAAFTSNRARDRVLSYSKPFLHSTLSILIKTSTTNDELPIFFMEDLLNQTEYKYGVLRGSHLEKDLKQSQEHVPMEIWKNIVKDKRRNVVRTLEEGIRKVRSEKFALIIPSTFATYLSSKSPCDLMSLDQFMFITNYMFALKKGNSLVDKVDEALIRLQEDGVLQMLFHKWWNTGDCLGATEPPKSSAEIKNVTTLPNRAQSSASWVHSMLTYSTKWKNGVTTTTMTTPSTTLLPTPPETTLDQSNKQVPSTPDSSMIYVDTTPSPMPSPTEVEDDVLGSEMTSVTQKVYTAVPVESTTEEGKGKEHGGRRRHRHRHRHRERGRGRARDRKKHRNRNNHNTTEVNTQFAANTTSIQSTASTVVLSTTMGTTTTTTTARPAPPNPPVWDGKYVYEDDLLSTRTPENYTINLELIPAEEDSIRIFPFTYKPHKPRRPSTDNPPIVKVPPGESPTAAPHDPSGSDGKHRQQTPTATPGGMVEPTWREVFRKTKEGTDGVLHPGTTPSARPGATPRDDMSMSGRGTRIMASACRQLFLISIVHVCVWWLCLSSNCSGTSSRRRGSHQLRLL